MNKIIVGVILVAAVAAGWFILNPGDTFDYVVTVNDEVEQLETELAEIDAAVVAGTLSPEAATEAKVKILTRLDSINASVSGSQSAKLTPAQQAQLNEGLNRLKTILLNYQATLSAVDEVAVEAEVKRQLSTKGRSSNRSHVSLAIIDTIENIEDLAEDVIDDYEAENEEEVNEVEAEVIVEIEENETEETEMENEVSEETEVEEENTDDSTPTESEGDDSMIDAEVSAEGEITQ